jgi:hypothetical protein
MAGETEHEAQLKQLEHLKAMGEKAYDEMYEAHSQSDINACYRDAKDYFDDAIALARRLGRVEEAAALGERLAHIKAVYRSQFAG